MENLHEVLVLSDLVIHQDGAMREFTHSRPRADATAHARKTNQQFDVVEQGIAETRGSFTVVLGNVADDFGEID
jgi:hypothetical protein